MADTPKIRFKGFMDAWERRKVSEICEQITDTINPADKPDDMFTEYSMPAFDNNETADVIIGKFMNSMRKVINKPCLLVNKLNVRKKRIWDVKKPENNAVCSAEFVPLVSINSDLEFLKYMLLTDGFTNYLEDCSSGTSNSQKRVTPDVIISAKIIVPKQEEQKIIGQYFSTLDNLITLHQRKCNETIELKKYMLKKMFPEEGREIPEIRFAGYTGAWERRKLGDMMFFSNGFNGSNESFGSGIALISVMDILNNDFITYDTIRGKAKVSNIELERFKVEYGDVLFQRSSENVEDAGTSNVYLDTEKIAIFGGFVIRGKRKVNYDPVFIKYLLDSPLVRKQVVRKAQGAQHINVSQEMLQDIDILYPLSEEDVKIGNLLRCLDGTITFHQCKCNELKEVKKFMLQNMFPQKG